MVSFSAWRATASRLAVARRGAAAIEFAMSGVALLAFIMAILNLGMLGFTVGGLAHAVQATARNAAVQTSASYATNGTFSCPASSAIVTIFNGYADPPLPAATGATSVNGSPAITATWTNNGNGTVTTEPPALYLTLTATYTFVPFGFKMFKAGIPLSMTTVATVMGSYQVSSTC